MPIVAHDDALAFRFRGGRPALNLVATVGWRDSARPVERLGAEADLAHWFAAAGLVPHADADAVARRDLLAARELREAIWRLALATLSGAPLAAADRAVVNEAARLPIAPPQLTADGRVGAPAATPAALLGLIARDAIELLGGEQARRLKQCAREDCTLLFVDESRSGRRRWCAMEACGNRAKTKHYRDTRRS